MSIRANAKLSTCAVRSVRRASSNSLRLVAERRAPYYLRSDNGPELVSQAILRWLAKRGIETVFIDPDKPLQDSLDESFNGNFRDEHLNME